MKFDLNNLSDIFIVYGKTESVIVEEWPRQETVIIARNVFFDKEKRPAWTKTISLTSRCFFTKNARFELLSRVWTQ